MTMADWLGFAGVGLLLVAFALNLIGRLARESRIYEGLNAAGAGMACGAAVLIGFYPFVVLEGIWALASVAALLQARG